MSTQQPEALLIAAWLRKSNEEAMARRIDGAEAIERQHARIEALEAAEQQHMQELRSYRITVENREARIAELEAEIERLRKLHQDAYQRGLQAGSRGLREAHDAAQEIKRQDAWGNAHLTKALIAAEDRAERAEARITELEARVQELEAQLVKESARTAEQKLRADQLEQQHSMQAKMHAQAAEQLAAAQQGVPEGWKLVPEEPTQAMYDRVMREGYYHDDPKAVKAVLRAEYQDMLAAAPQPPGAAQQGVSNRVLVDAGALQMVVNALRRDASEGRPSRGEMADELLLSATRHTPLGLDADMFWDADDPERCESSINNVVVEADSYRGLKVGDIVTIQRAARLPDLEVRVTQVPDAEGNGDLEWDVIDAAQAKQGGAA